MKTLAERFWEKVDKNGPIMSGMDTPCWVWTACTDGYGYGRIGVGGGKDKRAHVVAFEFEHGAVPAAMCVLHHCDNPPCVRHTYMGTKQDNARDREQRARGNHATGARHGCATHPGLRSGGNNGRAKIMAVDAYTIRELYAQGQRVAVLAETFDLSDVAIYDILHGVLWPDAGGPLLENKGRRRGVDHHMAALAAGQVRHIRAVYTGRYGQQKQLAAQYGVDVQTIRRVVRGKSYAV